MNILFVCKANIGRSQIAEAFLNTLSKKHVATSAGTHAGDKDGKQLTAKVILDAMREEGIDVTTKHINQLTPMLAKQADKIVMITEKADWPEYLQDNPKVTYWDVEDGKNMPYEFIQKMRDQIKRHVQELVREIE